MFPHQGLGRGSATCSGCEPPFISHTMSLKLSFDQTRNVVKVSHKYFDVVLHKPIPTKIRQLILETSQIKGQVDGFAGQLTSAKELQNTWCEIRL